MKGDVRPMNLQNLFRFHLVLFLLVTVTSTANTRKKYLWTQLTISKKVHVTVTNLIGVICFLGDFNFTSPASFHNGTKT